MVKGGNYAVFNVTQGITYTWSTCGSSGLAFNTQLTLFEGSTCGSGTVLAYNDDECGNKSSITWTATFTGTVTLLVSKYNCQVSSGYLEIPVSLKWSAIDNTGCDGDFCISARPFCTGTTYNFPAGVNSGVGEAGPNYCCLQTTPNPVWYYLFIDQPGNIDIYIHSDQSQDLDFICWGPFNNIFDPCQNPETYLTNSNSTCDDHHASGPGGGYPNGNTVDCSYDPASTEWCYIPNAQVGQFYILLITNYSNNPNNIIFEQTNAGQPGAGHTNCDIVYCSMTGLTAVPGTCDPATNSYSVSGQITFSNPPPGGQLVVTDNSGTTQSFNSPFTSPISYTLNGITSDGASHTITAYFTYAPSCSMTITYMAPASCVSCNATAGPTSTICQGESVQLTATGGVTYSWSPTTGLSNPNISNPIASPSSTTTYTVTTTDSQGCTASASVLITVTPSPTLTVTASPQNICVGQNSILTANGASTYSWSTGASTASITVTPTTTTTYTVTGYNGSCSSSATVVVNVSTNLNVTINANPPSVCIGGTSVLTASGGSTYSWSTGGSTASITVTPTATTTYTVTGSSGVGCSNTATVTVTVSSSPTISITAAPQSICIGGTSVLTASGASTYSWSTGGSTASITVTPTATTTYTVTGSSGVGCSNTATVTVSVSSSPTISITAAPQSICIGGTSVLTASGGSTYSWSTGGSTASITVTPTATTTYTVTGSSGVGCSNTATVTVTVGSSPTISITAAPPSICIGSTSVLTANGSSTYSWSTGGSTSSITVTPTTTTTYTVTGSSGVGCSGTATVSVTVNPLPTVSIDPSQSSICSGTSVILTANSDISGTSFIWSNNISGNNITVIPSTTTTYAVTGTTNQGCTGTASVTINVSQPPIIDYTTTQSHCGQSDGNIITNVTGGIPPFIYQWSNGANTSNLNNIPAGNYNLTITDANGCSSTINITLVEASKPQANFAPKPQITTIDDPIIYFENYSIGASSYQWDFGDGYSSTYFSPTHAYDFPGVYHVVLSVSDQYGCVDTVGANIIINDITNIFLPNAFTPNGNNINELYNIMGTGIDPSTFEMRIFDRWGKQLFYTTDYSASWDGTYNGEPVPQGSYIIAIKYSNKNNGNKYYIVDKIVIIK